MEIYVYLAGKTENPQGLKSFQSLGELSVFKKEPLEQIFFPIKTLHNISKMYIYSFFWSE